LDRQPLDYMPAKSKETQLPREDFPVKVENVSKSGLLRNLNKFRKSKFIKVQLIVLGIAGIIALIFFYKFILKGLPNPRGLKDYKVIPISSKIYDRNGELLYEIYKKQNRTPVRLNSLPDYVWQSTIAIEDADFFKHGGISIIGGMLRAAKDTFILKKGFQGGSTITQQLVKSALLYPERTIQRKIKEVILALWTEQILTKKEILELYMNQVPYGGVTYGIQEASQTFFGKDAKNLKIHEAALLAGLPRAPSNYSPITNFERAKRRQTEVLKRMKDLGYITEKQRKEAQKKKLEITPSEKSIKAPHFVFYIRSILEKQYSPQLVEEGGLKITTTLDYPTHASAEAILKDEIKQVKRLRIGNGAALITRPPTGEILAMIGSYDFFSSPSGSFNVTLASRQPGSSIKPINYAIGIDRKLVSPGTVFLDAPSCFIVAGQPKPYCPVNYDGKYHGPVSLRSALASSYNIPAVKMLALNTVEDFVASSSGKFGLSTLIDPTRYGLSLTLGGGEVRMVDMAEAFSSFSNEGTPKPLVSILKIEDKNGKVIYQYKDPNFVKDILKPIKYPKVLKINGKRAISKETAFLISNILSDNSARTPAFGASSNLVVKKKMVSVKTGTTNDLKDNWTIGYTPNFLVAVWVGNNDNTPMSYLASGITGAAPIWNRIMTKLLENQPDLKMRQPDGVIGISRCIYQSAHPADQPNTQTGDQPGCQTRFEYYIKGTENDTGVDVKREKVPVNKTTGLLTKPDDPDVDFQEKTVIVDKLGAMVCLDCTQEATKSSNIIIKARGDSFNSR